MTDDEFMEKALSDIKQELLRPGSRYSHQIRVIAIALSSAVTKAATTAVQEAVEREREACELIALRTRDAERANRIKEYNELSDKSAYHLWAEQTANEIAAAIRSRGQP